MDAPEDANLLATCPFCGYSLRTLPIEHRCPECGQPFDRHWRVFGEQAIWSQHPRRTRRLGVVWLVFCVGVLMVFALWELVTGRGPGWDSPPLFFLLWGAFMAYIVLLRPRRFVAVGPAGIVVCDSKLRRQQLYPWAVVGEACVQTRLVRGLTLAIDGRRLRIKGLLIVDVDECAAYINTYPRPADALVAAPRGAPPCPKKSR